MIMEGLTPPPNFLHAWITYKSERGFTSFDGFEDYLSTYVGFFYHYSLTQNTL